ncbi:MAG: rod shape-determining protein RodA [Desulfobacterales bacterium]|nr:rod shape-determining protein RodA [Desulfobacterales bacterium]
MFDRRLIEYFDWVLLLLTIILMISGIIVLYSAVNISVPNAERYLYYKQMMWYAVGFMGMCLLFLINYKVLESWAIIIYLFCIFLLICVLLFGKYAGGSKRWLIIGPVTIQPSELVKLGVIILLSKYYTKRLTSSGLLFKDLIIPMIIVGIPCGLIMVQPDLGTALLIIFISGSITLFVKIERKTFISIFLISITVCPTAWFFLKEYQQQRILTFLDPDRDPLGSGYHIIQSKIAIGSGMFAGKGYLKGTQKALSFLPEQHTDFILSVLAEEWGFIGTVYLILIFFMIIAWGVNIAYRCRDNFGTILSFGITIMLFWQIFINMGMVMGLLPVVGVPLPMISYGGSSVLTSMTGLGMLISISMRRFGSNGSSYF